MPGSRDLARRRSWSAWEDGRVSGQAGRYQRSVAGMIGSMVILVVVIAAFVVLREANRTTPEATVETVDYARTAEFAQDQLDFPIVQPRPLPDGWRATSVRFVPEPSSWHVGFLTDEDRYVGLEQARRSEQKMVESYVDPDAVVSAPDADDIVSQRPMTPA